MPLRRKPPPGSLQEYPTSHSHAHDGVPHERPDFGIAPHRLRELAAREPRQLYEGQAERDRRLEQVAARQDEVLAPHGSGEQNPHPADAQAAVKDVQRPRVPEGLLLGVHLHLQLSGQGRCEIRGHLLVTAVEVPHLLHPDPVHGPCELPLQRGAQVFHDVLVALHARQVLNLEEEGSQSPLQGPWQGAVDHHAVQVVQHLPEVFLVDVAVVEGRHDLLKGIRPEEARAEHEHRAEDPLREGDGQHVPVPNRGDSHDAPVESGEVNLGRPPWRRARHGRGVVNPGLLGFVVLQREHRPCARDPVGGQEEDHEGEQELQRVVVDGHGGLPAVEDARGSEHAPQLEEAGKAQDLHDLGPL
mmetsp:Transcript_128885/g.358847  ORF Transcript_128885/g.358847 Transcript_128885/m.358847 type:complete len:358 (+) Transcript_128885:437-1510(+)